VDFPIKNGDFPVRYVKLPEGTGAKHRQWMAMDGNGMISDDDY